MLINRVVSNPGRRFIAASAVLIVLATGQAGVAPACADPVKVSREVGVPLKEATELAQAGNYKGALAQISAADAAAKTPSEKYQIASVKRYVYVQTKSYDQLAETTETMIASGLMPPPEIKSAKRELIRIYDQSGNKSKTLNAAKSFVSEYGHDADLTIFVAAKAMEAKDYATAAEWASKSIEGELKSSRVPPEAWYKALMKARYEKGDLTGYYNAMEDTVKQYPSDTYWRALVGRATTQPDYSREKLELDGFRTLGAAGVELTTDEKLSMAESAFERELSGEALTILQSMEKSGDLTADAAKSARNQRLLNKARSDAEADRQGLISIVSDAQRRGDAVALSNVAELSLSLGENSKAIELYREALGSKNLDASTTNLIRLHLGMAQYRSGDAVSARKTWAAITGNDGTAELAKVLMLASNGS